jgi:hypothetical protein
MGTPFPDPGLAKNVHVMWTMEAAMQVRGGQFTDAQGQPREPELLDEATLMEAASPAASPAARSAPSAATSSATPSAANPMTLLQRMGASAFPGEVTSDSYGDLSASGYFGEQADLISVTTTPNGTTGQQAATRANVATVVGEQTVIIGGNFYIMVQPQHENDGAADPGQVKAGNRHGPRRFLPAPGAVGVPVTRVRTAHARP